jgi:hypothetical protein
LVVACATALMAFGTRADEIRLKDGKKLYGVIVAYEDNMFKVKTDFGFVLVEKDKIAAIIPTAPAGTAAPKPDLPAAKKTAEKSEATREAPALPAAPKKDAPPAPAKSATAVTRPKPGEPEKNKIAPKATSAAPTPAGAAPNSVAVDKTTAEKKPNPAPVAPAPPKSSAPAVPTVTAVSPAPAKPAPAQPPVNRESVEGNVYTNYTHGFRMYKPPSWKLIDDARKTIPNAIVAMGTSNESTLMVFGEEKSKKTLEATAADVEARLRDTYGNYRRISQRKTVAGGFPAMEIHYRGLADDHDWSGTLLIVSRSGDMFSILGMTYSDTDLIQIQENVIARAMASLEFNPN